MALKDLLKAADADRYTQDGRDKLNEALAEDVRYKTGDISQKTGLQKQPDGRWAPPKETKYGKVQQNKEGKWGVQQKLGKGSQFIEHKNEKEAGKALANYTAGYNTTERSKQDPHSNEARQVKQWNKETEKIAKGNKAERRAEHAAQFQKPAENKKPINYESEVKGMSDTLLELNLERNNKMPPEMRKAIENELAYRKAEGERDIAMQKAYAEKSESKPTEEPSYKWKTDYKSYLPKKNDELRQMYQTEKDPKIKQAIKKALQIQYQPEPFGPGDSASRELTGDCKIKLRRG